MSLKCLEFCLYSFHFALNLNFPCIAINSILVQSSKTTFTYEYFNFFLQFSEVIKKGQISILYIFIPFFLDLKPSICWPFCKKRLSSKDVFKGPLQRPLCTDSPSRFSLTCFFNLKKR